MYTLAVLAVVLCVVAGGTAAVWLFARHDRASAAFAFGVFLLVLTVWTVSHLGTLFSDSLQWLLFYKQLSYVGVVFAPVAWFAFAVRYTDRSDWLPPRRLAALSVVPVVTLAVVFTAGHHALFYESIGVTETAGGLRLATASGPWHVVNVVYSYALLLAGSGLLARAALTDNRLYRRQSAVLLTCIAVPWVVNAAYHLGWQPVPAVDVTPMAFIVTGLPLAALVVRTDLASFLPVAHERVFRSLDDPMLVVTPAGTVIDANDAAETTLGGADSLEGMDATEALPDPLVDGDALRADLDGSVECTLDEDGESRHYLARRQPVDPDSPGVSRGSVVVLTDITDRKARERELRALSERTRRKNRQLERMADVVAHDMRTPVLTAENVLTLLRADIDAPDDDVERSLDDLETVVDRLDEFVEHIPRLAREGTDVETVEACDLATVARDAWDVVETRDVTLAVAGTVTLEADRDRLRQAFENLFENAVQHGGATPRTTDGDGIRSTGADGRTMHAVAGESDAGDPTACGSAGGTAGERVTTVRVGTTPDGFYVEDDGPGIPSDRRENVFRYGVSSSDGSGFGLAIVRTVVEAHGWSVSVTGSELGTAPGAGGPTEPDDSGARFEIRTDD